MLEWFCQSKVDVDTGQQHLKFGKKDIEEAVWIASSSKAFYCFSEVIN